MPLIKRLGSSFIITTQYNTFLFDYPSDIIIPPLVDTIFISNSSSLSILYISENIPIYISHPVYIQLLYKHKLEKKDRSISDNFIKNVIFVNYNQILNFNNLDITVLSSGLYLGWCMYKIEDILYFSDISLINKVCKKISFCNVKYILWGNQYKNIDKSISVSEDINEFNNLILGNTKINLYVEFPNQLIDLLFHLNFLLNKSTKSFVLDSLEIKRYLNMCVSESDWLNDRYFKLTNIQVKSTDEPHNDCNIFIKKLPDNNNYFGCIKIEDKFYKLDTRCTIKDINDNLSGELLDLEEDIYYNLEDKNYEDVMIDGKIDIINNWGYLIGESHNKDDKDIYKKILRITKEKNFIEFLFKNERFVTVKGITYFMRIGVKISEEEGNYRISKI